MLKLLLQLLLLLLSLLSDSGVGDEGRVVDFFSERLQNLLPVLVEVSVDLVDGLLLDHPELTLGVANQPLVVGNDDDATC
jgi:hypothetical protein